MRSRNIDVLLVEDNPGDARLIREALNDAGARDLKLHHVDRLNSALDSLHHGHYDVMLLDLSLPDGDGIGTVQQAQEGAPDLPIIVLTGLDDEELARQALRDGAQDYLVKGRSDGHLLARAVRYAIERKAGEEALRHANETLRAVIQTSPVAIYTLDLDGKIRTWNAAAERIFGWSEAEVLGRPFPAFTSGPETADALQALLRGEMSNGFETVRRHMDGSLVDVAIWTSPLRKADGSISGVVVAATDISERKRLEEQLRQAGRLEAVGRLAGGVAHDFNNLLTIITGYSDLSLNNAATPEPVRRNIEEIRRAAGRAAALTNQLLAFSRKQVLQPKIVDLNSIVTDLEKMLRRLIGEDIDLEIALKPIDHVEADPGQLEQVIVNLVVNARQAMSSGGKLTIETSNQELDESYAERHVGVNSGKYVMISVTDTGHGMDAETQKHIFEPFFTTKEKGHGTGLGLATVYGIIKQSGGNIWVYSEPGKGTTFKIYLPVAKQTAELHEAPAPAPTSRRGSETILVVEDEDKLRKLISEVLTGLGYTVIEARNGPEALAIAGRYRQRIHLLLTDVVMPQMGGRELGDKLTKARPDTKVLYMSGYPDNAIVHQGVLEQNVVFLQKPFTTTSLSKKVREILET